MWLLLVLVLVPLVVQPLALLCLYIQYTLAHWVGCCALVAAKAEISEVQMVAVSQAHTVLLVLLLM